MNFRLAPPLGGDLNVVNIMEKKNNIKFLISKCPFWSINFNWSFFAKELYIFKKLNKIFY